MDLSCIISSGDIELYVLGILPPEEARKMEQLMLLFPEIKEEADRISETLEITANSGEAVPGIKIKENLFAELSSSKNDKSGINPNLQTESIPAPIVPFSRRISSGMIAASVITLISIAGLIYYVTKSSNQQKELAALHIQINQKEKEKNETSLAYDQMINVLKDYKQIDLNNVPGKPESLAKIFWHQESAQVYLMDVSLPPPPSGKQYQLWAIVDGKPLNAGLITETNASLQKMANFSKAEAFAITLEKSGGSTVPTLEEMFVLGQTS